MSDQAEPVSVRVTQLELSLGHCIVLMIKRQIATIIAALLIGLVGMAFAAMARLVLGVSVMHLGDRSFTVALMGIAAFGLMGVFYVVAMEPEEPVEQPVEQAIP